MKTATSKKIIGYIKKHREVRVSELISFLGLTPVAVHKQLKKLVAEGKLKKEGRGPHVFYLSSFHLNNLSAIKAAIVPVLHKNKVKKAAIFGSVARKEAGAESDIDILVDYPRHKSFFDFVGLKLALENRLGKKVDLVEYDTIKPLLREQILAEQIPIL